MSYNRIGEDFFISGSVSAAAFYGDGSNLTGISAGGGGGLTGSGTANYIAKFTSAGVLANSNIQDDGYPNGVGINYAPQAGIMLSIGNAVQPDTFYALNNYATSSTTRVAYFQNYGNPGTGPKLGIEVFVPTGANNYALKIQDGRQASGYVLTSDASGNAYWAANAGGGGGATPSLTQVVAVGNYAGDSIFMSNPATYSGYGIFDIGSIGTQTKYTAGGVTGTISWSMPLNTMMVMAQLNLIYNT